MMPVGRKPSRSKAAESLTIDLAVMVRKMPLSDRKVRQIARCVWHGEKAPAAEISIAVVGDKRMADLAERYAHRRYRTDVFSFELSEPDDPIFSGQIVINSQLARELAGRYSSDAGSELALYLIHGLLHLCGYDDHTDSDARVMHRRAISYLKKQGLEVSEATEELGR